MFFIRFLDFSDFHHKVIQLEQKTVYKLVLTRVSYFEIKDLIKNYFDHKVCLESWSRRATGLESYQLDEIYNFSLSKFRFFLFLFFVSYVFIDFHKRFFLWAFLKSVL